MATAMAPPPQDMSASSLDGDDKKIDDPDLHHSRHVTFQSAKKKAADSPLRTEHSNNSISSSNAKRQRADKRKGDRAKPADIYDRSRNYCRERRISLTTNLNKHPQDASVSSPHDQYRISPPDESNSILDAIFLLCSLALEDLASWVYAASFWMVQLFFMALYLLLVWTFVGLLLVADRYFTTEEYSMKCIANDDILDEDLNYRHIVEFAFALSWTTFTTVGYGRISPPGDHAGCYGVRFICSIEAIMGMGFVSMCSGIFYAKLLRFIGSAPVTFSSTLCVQYGKGLTGTAHISDSPSFNKGEADELNDDGYYLGIPPSSPNKSFNPYPVLEFRIVNNRANCPPGKNEIWDAQVNAIVELPLEQCETTDRRNSLPLDQYPTNKTINCNLKLSPSFHPNFCRIWFLRHVLDESSPLLKEEVRIRLKERGRWDAKLNNYQDIRKSLVEFNSIRIMMSGSSALSKGEVYAEKMYAYDDVFIGWKLVGVCFEDERTTNSSQSCRRSKRRSGEYAEERKTRVDMSLLHDICPQKGANYEPMMLLDDEGP